MEEPSPKKKRKRGPPKEGEEFVIKASLRGSLQGGLKEKKAIVERLKEWSDSVSQRIHFASRALTLILKECFHNSKDYKTTQMPLFLNQTFIRQLMLGLEGARKDNPILEEFFETYPQLLKSTPRFEGDRNLYSDAAKGYITNVRNSLNCIFEKRLVKFAKSVQKKNDWKENETIKIVKHKLLGDFLPKDIEELNLETKYPTLVAFINDVKDFLGLNESQLITPYWLQTNPYQVIRFYAHILKNLSPEEKSFNLLPLTSIRNHFAQLDTYCLLGLFKDVGLLKSSFKIEDLTLEYINSVFKIPKVGKGVFTKTIETDGTSICFHFRRPKVIYEKEEIDRNIQRVKELFKEKDTRKLSCDPGRDCIYTIVEEGSNKVWKLSRREYYSSSGIYKARGNTLDWSRDLLPTFLACSKVSSKGICFDSYKKYLEVFLATYDTLWLEYSKKRWAAQRFRLYGGKKRCLDNFWNKVLEDKDENGKKRNRQTVIAYGGAKMAPGGKGEMNVPTTGAFKVCQKRRDLEILVVDEFRTSKLHHQTHQLLHKVRIQGAKYSLRGLLWCHSTISQKQGFFVNRDVNAAWNILKIALERPEIFQRKKDQRRLPKQIIMKTISCKPETPSQYKSYSLGDCKRAVKSIHNEDI